MLSEEKVNTIKLIVRTINLEELIPKLSLKQKQVQREEKDNAQI